MIVTLTAFTALTNMYNRACDILAAAQVTFDTADAAYMACDSDTVSDAVWSAWGHANADLSAAIRAHDVARDELNDAYVA